MKARKNLMIGDWVYQALYKDAEIPNKGHGWKEVRVTCLPFDEDWAIEPIPLTEEILEKNGFRCVNENSAYTLMVMSDDGYTIEVYICIANCVFNVEHNYTLNKQRVMDRTHKCGYFVHELQHALRLCCLNDLADNFKV